MRCSSEYNEGTMDAVVYDDNLECFHSFADTI